MHLATYEKHNSALLLSLKTDFIVWLQIRNFAVFKNLILL